MFLENKIYKLVIINLISDSFEVYQNISDIIRHIYKQ